MSQYYAVSEEQLTAIADSIRAKTGSSAGMEVSAMPANVESIIGSDTLKSIIDRSATDITLPEGLTTIGSYAFNGCTKLAAINLPESVTAIGIYAFYGCADLATINLPESVTTISSYTFYGCSKLALTALPDSLQTLGTYAFLGCTSLKTLKVPSGVSTLNSQAFSGCTALETVDSVGATAINAYCFRNCALSALILRADTLCTLANVNAFSGSGIASGTGYIYVPAALVEEYKAATNWATYADQIRAIEDYPDITGG